MQAASFPLPPLLRPLLFLMTRRTTMTTKHFWYFGLILNFFLLLSCLIILLSFLFYGHPLLFFSLLFFFLLFFPGCPPCLFCYPCVMTQPVYPVSASVCLVCLYNQPSRLSSFLFFFLFLLATTPICLLFWHPILSPRQHCHCRAPLLVTAVPVWLRPFSSLVVKRFGSSFLVAC
jgi:hypothetical protein